MNKHKNLNLLMVQQELQSRGLSIFTPQEFERIFNVPPTAVRQFIHAYTEKRFFAKLRNGLYTFEDKRPNLYVAANKIYRPSYVSLDTALSYYGIIPEVVYSITSVTPKPTREFGALGIAFNYTRIKQAAFGGYTTKQENGNTFLIAEPEKALIDYLYFVLLGKRMLNDRLYLRRLDFEKVHVYAAMYNRSKLMELVEKAQKMPLPEIM